MHSWSTVLKQSGVILPSLFCWSGKPTDTVNINKSDSKNRCSADIASPGWETWQTCKGSVRFSVQGWLDTNSKWEIRTRLAAEEKCKRQNCPFLWSFYQSEFNNSVSRNGKNSQACECFPIKNSANSASAIIQLQQRNFNILGLMSQLH